MSIDTLHGTIETPAFLPDATYGTIKSLTFADAKRAGVREIVTTTLHLEQKVGSEYIKQFGDIHEFFGWDRPILTDSGGFQVFSLIHRRANKANKVSDVGCSFVEPATGKFNLLTPEISQIIQHNLGSDIRVVLDEPIIHDAPISEAKEAVRRNTLWARRSKQKFLELHGLSERDFNDPTIKRPLLVAVIQGANYFDLRARSAAELLEIGFDIYGFGGLPIHNTKSWKNDAPTGFNHELLDFVTNLVPQDKLKYGFGIGSPDDLVYCSQLGWDIFDAVLPTRNARHGYLYVAPGQGDKQYQHYDILHINNKRYEFDKGAIDTTFSDDLDEGISRAYLRHLLRVNDPAGYRIASLHNLRFYSRLMSEIRAGKLAL